MITEQERTYLTLVYGHLIILEPRCFRQQLHAPTSDLFRFIDPHPLFVEAHVTIDFEDLENLLMITNFEYPYLDRMKIFETKQLIGIKEMNELVNNTDILDLIKDNIGDTIARAHRMIEQGKEVSFER